MDDYVFAGASDSASADDSASASASATSGGSSGATASTAAASIWGLWSAVRETASSVAKEAAHKLSDARAKLNEGGGFLEAYKSDLREIVSTVRSDVVDRAQHFLLGDEPRGETASGEREQAPPPPPPITASRLEKQLYALESSTATYSEPLPSDDDAVRAFRASWSVDAATETMSGLLRASDMLRYMHTRLVPRELPLPVFWERYLFRRGVLVREHEAVLQSLEAAKRASQLADTADGASWGDDNDDDDDDVVTAHSAAETAAVAESATARPDAAPVPSSSPPPPPPLPADDASSEASWEQVDEGTPGGARAPAARTAAARPASDSGDEGWDWE